MHGTAFIPMRSPNKWFVTVSPDRAISRAARRALRPRFKALRHYLVLAAERAEDDVEHVHQLRVAVRRAVAAVRLFQDLLPGRRRWLKKQCQLIRRAAGPARDLDVLSAWLTDIAVPADFEPARAACLAHVAELRRAAQPELCRRHAKLPDKKLRRRMRSLLRSLRRSPEANGHAVNLEVGPTFAEDAPRRLEPIAIDFLAAAETDCSDLAHLHQLRIQGKRLRYALEALAGAFPSEPFQNLYASVRELQERLGEINDRATAQRYLEEWSGEDRPAQAPFVQTVKQQNADALEAARQACAAWWTAERVEAIRLQFRQLAPALEFRAPSPKLYESA